MFSFKGQLIVEYKLKVLTGMRIGGSKESFDIGGLDNPVIKTVISILDFYGEAKELPAGVPYIPGSSLKGKIRSLLEWANGNVESMIERAINDEKTEGKSKEEKIVEMAGKPSTCGKCDICVLFGTGDVETIKKLKLEEQPGPPRLIFYDAYPTEETLKNLEEELGPHIYTEIKTENHINRITSKAEPRKVERVPAGAVFEGKVVFRFFKDEDRQKLSLLFNGMKLLEDNFLGGYGSRGSGRVKFENIRLTFRSKDYYLGKGEEKSIGAVKSLEELDIQGLADRL
ncbi:MAG: type III-A CRISPR-associated RAMP protein Csm3 [Hydrogenobacter sp.]